MIIDRIETWARSHPSRTALVHNGRALSYRGFADAIWATHRQLMSSDLPSDGVAAILAGDLLNAWLLTMAARAAGLTTMAVRSLEALEALAGRDLACVLVAESERRLSEDGARSPNAQLVWIPVEAFGAPAALPPLLRTRPLGDYILYTSGTTGTYKKLRFEGRLEDGQSAERGRQWDLTFDTIFHASNFGLWTGMGFRSPSSVWRAGGAVVTDQRPDSQANVFHHGVNCIHALPETLKQLVAAHPGRRAPGDDDVTMRVGGGFTPLHLAEQATAALAKTLIVTFSSTETLGSIMEQRFRSPDDLQWLTPAPGRRAEVVDDDGAPLPAGVEGRLRVKLTDLDSHAYLDDEAATAQAFRDGFFYPGDLAMTREDGRIRILGRAADVINIAGQKRAVGPIEETLRQALEADEVCAFTGVTQSGEEEIVLAVRTLRPPSEADVKRILGGSQIFQRVRVEIFADFPRTNTGKTRRIELRQLLFGE
jgi:acyl-coenzyme A synthetase/AMP-(fatty) acid ligase